MESREENTSWYLTVNGSRVEVTEEVYRAYRFENNRVHKLAWHERRCAQPNFAHCNGDCLSCSWHTSGTLRSIDATVSDYKAELASNECVEDSAEKTQLLKFGKIRGYEGHHIKTVKELAGTAKEYLISSADDIVFLTNPRLAEGRRLKIMARRRANGEGSIRKRSDGSWEGRITIGYDPFGKQVMKSVSLTSSLRMQMEVISLSLLSGRHSRRHWRMLGLIIIVCMIVATLSRLIPSAQGTTSRRFRKTWGIIPQHLPWIATAMSRKRCARKAQTGCRPSFRECRETEEEIHKWVRYG